MADTKSDAARDRRTSLVLSWRSVAIAAFIFGLTSLVALLVVSTIRDVNALATVALALAITTFIIQIIFYIVQSESASRQSSKNQELNAASMNLLVQVQEKMAGTQETVGTISNRLLDHILGTAFKDVSVTGSPIASADFQSAIIERAQELASNPDLEPQYPAKDWPESVDAEILAALQTLPPESELQALASAIEGLGDMAQLELIGLANDEYTYRHPTTRLAPGAKFVDDAGEAELIEKGIAERYLYRGSPFIRLTGFGREVARLLIAPDPIPSQMGALATIRARYQEFGQGARRSIESRGLPPPP